MLESLNKLFSITNKSKLARFQYPLGDLDKFQNTVKFTALAREQKSGTGVLASFTAPQFVNQALGSVSLYMPAGLQINDNLSYDNVDTGIGGMLTNMAQNSGSTSEFFKAVAGSSQDIIDRAISQKLAEVSGNKGIVGGVAGQLLINRGEVINPHTEMLFRSPALRQFNFNFKMIARSKAEALEIKNIVKFFRLAAYPSLGNLDVEIDKTKGSLEMATYKFPDIFSIQYYTNGKINDNLVKFQYSYLTSVNLTYNQTSPIFFEDGMPSEVDLSLTFQESKAISRADVEKGY